MLAYPTVRAIHEEYGLNSTYQLLSTLETLLQNDHHTVHEQKTVEIITLCCKIQEMAMNPHYPSSL